MSGEHTEISRRTDIFENYSVPKAVLTLAVPTVVNHLMTTIYNLADTFFIGQTGNVHMVAAVSLGGAAMMITNAMGALFGMGGSSFISRALGAKKLNTARAASAFCIYAGLLISLLVGSLIIIFLTPFAGLAGASSDTIEYAKEYLFWTMGIGSLPTVMAMVLGSQIRAEGMAKHEMIGMVSAHILNCALDPILIFALDMGVAGAAIATMLSNVLACCYYFVFIRRNATNSVINFHFKKTEVNWAMIKDIFMVGLPAALNSLINSASRMVLNNLIAGYGDDAVAAMGIVRKLDEVPMHIAAGFTQGVMPLIGYNYAAKNFDRMEHARKYSLKLSIILTSSIGVLLFAFAPLLIGLFISDASVISHGAQFLRIHVFCLPFLAANFAIRSMFQAMGKGPRALIVSICRQGVIYVPLMYLMNVIVGVHGVVAAQIAADGLSLIVAYALRAGVKKEIGLG